MSEDPKPNDSMSDPGMGPVYHLINFKTGAVLKHQEFEEAFYAALGRTTILEELSEELGTKVEIRRFRRAPRSLLG